LRRNILKIRKKLEKIEEEGYFSGEEILGGRYYYELFNISFIFLLFNYMRGYITTVIWCDITRTHNIEDSRMF